MTPEQIRFLILHARHLVVKWHWMMQGTQLRAFCERGHTATISKAGHDALVTAGLIEPYGAGAAGVRLTEKGRMAA